MSIIEQAKSDGLLIYLDVDELARFAARVRAAALEEAAGVCETEWSNVAEKMYGEECAAAIRALKDKATT